VDSVPLVVFEPDHAPDAVQLTASLLLHVSVALSPLTTDVGFEVRDTVGVETPGCTASVPLEWPPHPERIKAMPIVAATTRHLL